MTVNEYLQRKNYMYSEFEGIRGRLHCKDGFSISVQASRFHYCTPRVTNAAYYDTVELGYPSEVDTTITDYAEDTNYTDTVYGYVPVHIVDALIQKHGGIDESFLKEGLA